MTIFGNILTTKECHFDSIVSSSGEYWCLNIQDKPTGFWLPLHFVQALAKQFDIKKVRMLNKKIEGRKIVITYDGFSVLHGLTLKSNYRGPKIPEAGLIKELENDKDWSKRRDACIKDVQRDAAREGVSGEKELPPVGELLELLGDF